MPQYLSRHFKKNIFLIFLLGFIVVIFVAIRLWPYIADDTFIALRYSKHFAQGKGLVFNVGEYVDGYTDFLWVMYLTLPFFLQSNPIVFLKITNILLIFASSILLYYIGRKTYFNNSPIYATLPPFLFLVTPFISYSAAEGLETILFVFLTLLTLLLFLKESKNRFPASAAILNLLVLTRPDGLLLLPVFLIGCFIKKATKKYIFLFLLIFFILFVPFFVAHFIYYHDFLPNTFYAKPGGILSAIKGSFNNLAQFMKVSMVWIIIFFLPHILRKRFSMINFLLFGIIFTRLFFHIWSGGAIMGIYRFLIPALPFLYLLIFAGIFYGVKNKKMLNYYTIIVIAILLVCWRWYPQTEQQLITYGNGLNKAHIALAKEIKLGTTQNAIIALGDVGALPFYSERTAIDILALTDRHLAHLPGGYAQKLDRDYLLKRKPDIIIFTSHTPYSKSIAESDLGTAGGLFPYKPFRDSYRYNRTYTYMDGYYLIVYEKTNSNNILPQFNKGSIK